MLRRELIIFIANLQQWKYVESWPEILDYPDVDNYWKTVAQANQKARQVLQQCRLTGVYLGNEFCERLMPSLEEIVTCHTKCQEKQLRFTLVTPLVSERGIDTLDRLFRTIDMYGISLEIVFNDWGVARLLEEKYPHWPKRMGRTLDKMIREPRFNQADYNRLSTTVLNFLQEPAGLGVAFLNVLQEYNIHGIELDCVPQGYNIEADVWSQHSVSKSIYFPFYCVTSGRLCMMKALELAAEDKWNLDVSCTHTCQTYNQMMQKFVLLNGKKAKVKLLRKGNAIFGCNQDYSWLQLDIWNRLVWQPQIPM